MFKKIKKFGIILWLFLFLFSVSTIVHEVGIARQVRTVVQPAVQLTFRELVTDLRGIENPYFIFDVDKTLLPKDVDLSEPGDNYRYKWTLETLRKALKKAEENGTMVGIISANSRAYVNARWIQPLRKYLAKKGQVELM